MEHYAIIGSSPIMLIASLLIANQKKEKRISIFNKDKWLGGAWRKAKTPYGNIPTHNNIILPLNNLEQENLINVKRILETINIECKISETTAKIIGEWQPRYKLIMDIDDLSNNIINSKNIQLKFNSCNSIKLLNNELKVNNLIFNKCFFPNRFSNINFFINNKKIELSNDVNISHHYTFIFKKNIKSVEEIEYTENFDKFFDRGQINILDDSHFVFIGRLRRKFKKVDPERIIFIYKNKIFKDFELCYFKKNIYKDKKVSFINFLLEKENKKLINIGTDQFINSFLEFYNFLNLT